MRIVLTTLGYFNDPDSAAMANMRALLEALAQAGHHAQALCGAWIEGGRRLDPEAHLRELGITFERVNASKNYTVQGGKVRKVHAGLPILGYDLGQVRVAMALTQHHDARRHDSRESKYFLGLLDGLIAEFGEADVLLACGSHPVLFDALELGRDKGLVSAFHLYDRSCEDPRWFRHVNHAFTFDPALTEHYAKAAGVTVMSLPAPGHADAAARWVEYFTSLEPGASPYVGAK